MGSLDIDWYDDDLPGAAFGKALAELRKQAAVVPVRALGGALRVFYIVRSAASWAFHAIGNPSSMAGPWISCSAAET